MGFTDVVTDVVIRLCYFLIPFSWIYWAIFPVSLAHQPIQSLLRIVANSIAIYMALWFIHPFLLVGIGDVYGDIFAVLYLISIPSICVISIINICSTIIGRHLGFYFRTVGAVIGVIMYICLIFLVTFIDYFGGHKGAVESMKDMFL